LFAHPKVIAVGGGVDEQTATRALVRAAIWLTPKSG
jgi:shikimate kinase